MDSSANANDILHDLTPLLVVYKDGRVERIGVQHPYVGPSLDPTTGVDSKDIINIIPETGVSVRLYKPSLVEDPKKKLPLLVFTHGGGFCIDSAFIPLYQNYLNDLASQAQILIVSVEYRLAPEHPLPAAYDDCWNALQWVFDHHTSPSFASSGNAEPWLLENADFSRVYLSGDSAGANIAHHLAMRIGNQGLTDGSINRISGMVLFHSYFWGKDRIGDEAAKLNASPYPYIQGRVWEVCCPNSSGIDDPWINPAKDPNLSKLGCERVLIFVAEEDSLRDRGFYYKAALEKSGWQGKAEVVESLGENHGFHLYHPERPTAIAAMKKVVDFLKSF